jgi:hypothetical protein
VRAAFDFAVLFLHKPEKAAEACRREDALRLGLIVYAVSALVSLIFSWFNPLAFLDPNSPVLGSYGAGFWLRVAFWEPALFALSVWFGVLLLDWLRDGWLPMKASSAALWTAIPPALAASYVSPRMQLGRGVFAAALAVWTAPALVLSRRPTSRNWREVCAFLLGLNAVQTVGLVATLLIVVPARSLTAFYVVDGAVLLWMLAIAGLGLRRLVGVSTARAVIAFLFSVALSTVVPAVAYLLGLLPKEVLKVLLYV